MTMVRRPAVAGSFYPEEPEKLRDMIEALLRHAGTRRLRKSVRGIVVPHAGYFFSGLTAAYAYAALGEKPRETVVIVAPSHWDLFEGISVYPGDAYETPLGEIEIDDELRAALLAESDMVMATDAGHRTEHSLEVQLPFLQEVWGEFRLLPLVMGNQRQEVCNELAASLATVLSDVDALLVASTDLSHYHSAPVAERKDAIVRKHVSAFDPEGLMTALESGEAEACGGGPTVAMLSALRMLGATQVHELHYAHSGEASGDYDRVVGYLAAAVT